jgi:hypothetical protein
MTMHLIRTLLALMALMALSLSSLGQDTEVPEEEAAAPPPPDTRPLDEIFIPSEEIAADEEVTFPVNI